MEALVLTREHLALLELREFGKGWCQLVMEEVVGAELAVGLRRVATPGRYFAIGRLSGLSDRLDGQVHK